MSFLHYSIALATAMLSLFASAQQKYAAPSPADGEATVPQIVYQSAFNSYQSSSEEQATPDKTWRASNDEMGRLKGHAGHLSADRPAAPPASQEPAATVRRHMHH
ncbi:MAG TPA: hypothetical protein VEC35_09100 [Noviherbaspirillum sp.]|nr:hypothetical protein [Noviherbaspirillum sp.]